MKLSTASAVHPALGGVSNQEIDLLNDFKVVHNLDTRNNDRRLSSFLAFTKWVERFVAPNGETALFKHVADGNAPADIEDIKHIGTNIAVLGKAPVFGKVKGTTSHGEDAKGEVEFYPLNQVKNQEFIWAAWADYSDKDLESGAVPEQFKKHVASTLKMFKKLL